MQIVNQQNMEKRTLFYWSKLYTQGIHEGEMFHKLKKTITINLLDFNYFDTKQYHTKWHIVEDIEKDKILTDVLGIHFIELKKFIQKNKMPENNKEHWLYFIDNTKREMVNMATQKNKIIGKAKEELDYLTGDEEMKRMAELREKGIRDYNSGMAYAEEKGIQKNKIEVAKEMLKKGFDIELIAEITKLSIDEIRKLK